MSTAWNDIYSKLWNVISKQTDLVKDSPPTFLGKSEFE